MSEAFSIGWIGLGKLGLPMAARLASNGEPVYGFDRDAKRLTLAAERSVKRASSLAEAVTGRDIVFTSLPDGKALLSAIVADGGVLTHMRPRAVLCETSTVSPEDSARVAEAAADAGVTYLRLPISGSSMLAEAGTVTCFASGPRDAFEDVRPVLARFTRAQTWLGEAEQARYAKLAINLMVAVSAGMMAEALALARKGGIDWGNFLGVMAESAAGSPFVKYKAAPLEKRDFSPTFTAHQIVKDLDLILEATGKAGIPSPLAASVRQSYSGVLSAGAGEEDFITIVRYLERLSGLGEP
jgi:3-hydroxyisobutyrate dehydrogenase-like beta-hydroxyacid dehydrogenase